MASITTRHGDDGTTSLLFGQRVPKFHPQIEAVGACDTLTVALGAVRQSASLPATAKAQIRVVQQNLVALMGELACADGDSDRYLESRFARLTSADLDRLDQATAGLEAGRQSQKSDPGWAIPGDAPQSIAIEQARVAARTAERRVSQLGSQGHQVRPEVLTFLNRLSDYLWLLARSVEDGNNPAPVD